MEIRRGEIYWVEKHPWNRTIGHEQFADRPAIIVSNDANNRNSGTVEIVYLTASPKKKLPTHCLICSAVKPSIALCEQVTTISTECIGRYISVCTEEEMRYVDECIRISLGLQNDSSTLVKNNSHQIIINENRKLEEDLIKAVERETLWRTLYIELRDSLIQKGEKDPAI